ncbi:Lipase, secreted [Beauveria brongniartii RCEF 3172]|uniref:Lipase, secreted n=1 Tax=Beauveria brongniartii RCEF 3172 TaxID=1081107 RepID=A0A166WTI2_9HYPO|nr:Lipase, secreted [Beauveria brongniartii RCEF 3172]
MKLSLSRLAYAAVVLTTVIPCVSTLAVPGPKVAAAGNDPFYDPPPGFEAEDRGTVLRSRRIVASFFGFIPAPVKAYQVLYRTTAVNGSAIAGVTTVFKPAFAKNDRFVSYHAAYDSSASACSPSYAYKLGHDPAAGFITNPVIEFLVIQLYLLSGYIVSSPDYEGPDAAFSPGYLSGMVALDSMRAVGNFGETLGLKDDPSIVGVGYSGGALATAWAAAMQPIYAPELSIKGWSAGGIPANFTNVFDVLDGTVVSGFVPIAIAGILKPSAHGAELQPLFERIITPLGRKVIELASTKCTIPNLVAFPFQSILDTKFQSLGRGLLADPTVQPILTRNTLGVNKSETPTAPVHMYHATPDEVVPYGPAAILRKSWCDYGATVKFTNFAAGGHVTTVVLALGDTLHFVRDAFAGKLTSGCESRDVFDDELDPLAFGLNLEPLAVGLINWLGAMGKKDENWLRGIESGRPI